jgi:hypothetical protein
MLRENIHILILLDVSSHTRYHAFDDTNCDVARDEDPSEELEDELMKLTRENVKLCDELAAAIEGDSEQDTNSLLGALNLLSALRESSEAEVHTPAPRAASTAKVGRNAKRKGDTASVMSDDRESAAADSPAAPSPKIHVPVPSRLKLNTANAGSRATSVGAGREASVKIEEGLESGVDAKCIGDPLFLNNNNTSLRHHFYSTARHAQYSYLTYDVFLCFNYTTTQCF